MSQTLCSMILSKIDEQVQLTDHLISLLPDRDLHWKPTKAKAFTAAALLSHLLECLAGFCAVLIAVEPSLLIHFSDLRALLANHSGDQTETRKRIHLFIDRIHEGFSVLDDSALYKLVPTVFVKSGEPLLTLLLGNLEHFINHKHQLFMYLQLIGINLGSKELYRFRGE